MVKSSLLALHTARPGYVSKNQKQTAVAGEQQQQQQPGSSPGGCEQSQGPGQGLPGHSPTAAVVATAMDGTAVCNNVGSSNTMPRSQGGQLKHQDSIPHHNEYDEEEWVSALVVCTV